MKDKSKFLHRWTLKSGVASLAILATSTVATNASAGVSNPGSFTVYNGTDSGFFAPGINNSGIVIVETQNGAFADVTVDANGDIAFDAFYAMSPAPTTLTSVSNGKPISVALTPQLSGNSGHVDLATGELTLSLRFKLVFTWGSQIQLCSTSAFTITTSTSKTFDYGGGSSSGLPYNYVGDGSFIANASDFEIPAISTSMCDGAANQSLLNTAFGLGAGPGADGFKFDRGSILSVDPPYGPIEP